MRSHEILRYFKCKKSLFSLSKISAITIHTSCCGTHVFIALGLHDAKLNLMSKNDQSQIYGMQWKIYHTQYRDNSISTTYALKNMGIINCEKTQQITQNCIVLGMSSKWCHEQDFFLKQSHSFTSETFVFLVPHSSRSFQSILATDECNNKTYTWWCFHISEY